MTDISPAFAGDRLAKVIARAGLCSRRDAELWIKDGRVAVNGKVIRTPAFNVTPKDKVKIDGQPLAARQGTRVWLYHKPPGLVVTEKDPEGRPTIFDTLERQGLPRVVSIGRLDINTEGLLLLTNDGGLKRVLELPATGWLRRYRVRAFGTITQPQLDALKDGVEFEGVKYGPIEATLERDQGSNVWLLLALREGKNREVKNVLAALGLKVNRLIRVSFGPFQLGDMPIGGVEVVKARVLREQLGKRLADEAGVDFDSDLPEPAALQLARQTGPANPAFRAAAPGKAEPRQRRRMGDRLPERPRDSRPPRREFERPAGPPRKVFHDDGSASEFETKTYGKRPKPDRADARPPFRKGADRSSEAADRGTRPPFRDGRKPFAGPAGDRAARPRSDSARADRPKRSFGGAPGARKPFAGPPRERRPEGAADRPDRPHADRPKRSFGGAPGTRKPFAGPPRERRPEGAADRPARPHSDRPKRSFGAKPGAPRRDMGDGPKRPRGSGPGGDRPRRPRPPKP